MKQYPNKLWILVGSLTIFRLLVALFLELGNDEVYYWTYAQHLQWDYFDHPPMVALSVWLSTFGNLLHPEVFVRLGAIVASATSTLLIYRLGQTLYNERAGWYASLLYSASFYGSLIAGTFILPDSPQMPFWLAGILLLFKINKANQHNLPTAKLWCWFGLIAGICTLCKVHGLFLWVAVGLFALLVNRNWLKDRWLYLAGLISLIVISPILIWNIQHQFITYTYHGSRVSLAHARLNYLAFAREIFGEIFYNNPAVFCLTWISIWQLYKRRFSIDKKEMWLLLCTTLPLIFTLLVLALFRETLPHWSGPAYSVLLLVAATNLAKTHAPGTPKIIVGAMAFFFAVAITGIVLINCYPGTLNPQQNPLQCGKGDITLDLYGWKEAGLKFDSLYRQDVALQNMPAKAPIIINKWFPAAHIDYYLCSLTQQSTWAIGNLFDLHQYQFYNAYKRQLAKGDSAYYVIPSNLFDQNSLSFNQGLFTKADAPVMIPLYRNKLLCRYLLVYRLRGFKGYP
ncbi:glycosyltransferase family 39 protein [Pedobacter sp. KR3-3]|uniref:Glycosyltransferase family 39 protein n=1 Tax=Pedobacter albus TaxID=3113905 RepID=A0ABU7IC95_9SPHI|nr:glycosyltransferase family 39 protein [Pedobacter sp. KR3-3]MEE1946794.1 glycosyltransferase family 39 protein [Pedobacter sp. KR3-3]